MLNHKKMIAVIADDFTGAAEIGGIGLRHGLDVVIESEAIQHQTDLLVINADTRALSPEKAVAHITQITRQLMTFLPVFIYKKLDSVLRGHVVPELLAQMEASEKKRILIVAANPVLTRIIQGGIYYIDQVPLHETYFSSDPHFPITSSSVLEILNPIKGSIKLVNLKPHDTLPEEGLIVGDVAHLKDLDQWAMKMDEHTLMAGASGFFNALLGQQLTQSDRQPDRKLPPVAFGEKALFVFGSSISRDPSFFKKLDGHVLSNMPEEIYYNKQYNPHHFEQWVEEIVQAFRVHHKVIVAILHAQSSEPDLTSRIQETIGLLIKEVVQRVQLNELLIEGGSTTSAILSHLGVRKLWPVQELDTGVIRMKMEGNSTLYVTTKPGSYVWPEDLWVSQQIQRANHL